MHAGDEIGMFHFGGSTDRLMSRDGVDVTGFPGSTLGRNAPLKGRSLLFSRATGLSGQPFEGLCCYLYAILSKYIARP